MVALQHKVIALTFQAPLHLLVISCLLHVGSLSAQQVTGNLQGTVVDSLGQPVSGADVEVMGTNIQGVRRAVSDTFGNFAMLGLPPGEVSAAIRHVAYQAVTIEDVFIQLGRTTHLGEIRLASRIHEVPEVLVVGDKPRVDPTTASNGVNLRSSEFESLPIERNYRSIAALIPQANLSYFGEGLNVAGATGRENKFYMDGVDITDSHFGETQTDLPYNFVKEIQVITGGYEAEYRSSLGGVVNVVTHSGTNEVHGSLVAFYTSDWLSARTSKGLIDPSGGAFSNYDFGGGIGFPLIRDQLWMYFSYNPTYDVKDVQMPGLGTYVDRTISHPFAGKLSWKATERLNLVLSVTGSPSNRTAIEGDEAVGIPVTLENPDPYLRRNRITGTNPSLNGSYVARDNILLEASISKITRNEYHEPFTNRGKNEILFSNTQTGVWSGGSTGSWSFLNDGIDAKLTGTFLSGSHKIKAGIGYRDNGPRTDVDVRYYQYPSPYNDTLYFQLINRVIGTTHNRIPSAFVQDSWQITSSITLKAGLRWDGQFLIATNGKVAQKITDQFQPRVGFVFLPGDGETQKISGSFGRFFQEINTIVSAGYHSDEGYHYEVNYYGDPRSGTALAETVVVQPFSIEPEIAGLKGQYYDEFTLGYERVIGAKMKVAATGVYRSLREAIDDAWIASEGRFLIGNPGRGKLSRVPRPRRDYMALVLSIEQRNDPEFNFYLSYVLSRNYGNYPGLFDVSFPNFGPNTTTALDDADPLNLGTGLLPNDRTHVLKLWTSYRLGLGITVGSSFTWQSGTPISEWAGFGVFVTPRGTSGRTPAIWDLNARVLWDLPFDSSIRPRVILDVFHIASQRKPVNVVQQRYFSVDQNGNGVGLNPDYGKAYRYQPPMSVRLGLEMSF